MRLYLAIAGANDVKTAIQQDSRVVYPTGMPTDLDHVEAMYSTLVVHMSATCEAYLRSGAHRNETVTRIDRHTGRVVSKPVHGSTARSDFYRAYITRIGQRLSAAAETAEETAEQEATETSDEDGMSLVSTALVLREKRREVERAYEDHAKAMGVRGSYKGGRTNRSRGAVASAVAQGRASANDADLTPPTAPRGSIATGAGS